MLSVFHSCGWLTAGRARTYGIMVLAGYLAFFGAIAAGIMMRGEATDFISFYAAAIGAARDGAMAVYSEIAHFAVEKAVTGNPGQPYFHFFYPPVAILLLLPLAALPYGAAFLAWGIVQAGLFVAMLRNTVERAEPLAPILALPAAMHSLLMGQNGLLSATIIGGGLLLLHRGRPLLAGLVLGCLIYKPHLGLLLPIALIAGREWRAVVGAVVAVVGLALVAAIVFGPGVWLAYTDTFLHSNGIYGGVDGSATTMRSVVQAASLQNVYGTALGAGAGLTMARVAQVCAIVAAAAVVARIWSRPAASPAARAMALVAGTLMAAPIVLFYDFAMVAVALAWSWREARSTGWMPWEKVTYLGIYGASGILALSQVTQLSLPIGPMACGTLLALAWRRQNSCLRATHCSSTYFLAESLGKRAPFSKRPGYLGHMTP